MSSYLLVSQEDPVILNGSIDAAGELQLTHDTDSLSDHDQEMHAEHSILESPTATIQVRVSDFGTWTINAAHGGTYWARASTYAYANFGEMGDLLEVDLTATSGTNTKTRKIWIKTLPDDGQPDPRP